jgi:hypothetical protein
MDRLVARAKAQQRADELADAQAYAAKCALLEESERKRVALLPAIVRSWLAAMKAADYPGVSVQRLTVLQGTRVTGFFKTTLHGIYGKEDAAGWIAGRAASIWEENFGSLEVEMFLCVDGTCLRRAEIVGAWVPHTYGEPGPEEIVRVGDAPTFYFGSSTWLGLTHAAEASIPANLSRIAAEHGVNWKAPAEA